MATKTRPAEVPLMHAAMEARLSYGQALRKILIGEWTARKVGRNWLVSRESVTRSLGEREDVHVPAA